MIDVDDPTVEGLQALLLLSQAFFAYGLGKKAYMTFCTALPLSHPNPSLIVDIDIL